MNNCTVLDFKYVRFLPLVNVQYLLWKLIEIEIAAFLSNIVYNLVLFQM